MTQHYSEENSPNEDTLNEQSRKIGLAADRLFSELPSAALSLSARLRDFAKIGEEELQEVLADSGVQAADAFPVGLLLRGVQPNDLTSAADAVGFLLARAVRRDVLSNDVPIWLSIDGAGVQDSTTPVVPRDSFVQSIRDMASCSADLADVLFDWAIETAKSVPHFFPEFQTVADESGSRLLLKKSAARDESHIEDLLKRWKEVD